MDSSVRREVVEPMPSLFEVDLLLELPYIEDNVFYFATLRTLKIKTTNENLIRL